MQICKHSLNPSVYKEFWKKVFSYKYKNKIKEVNNYVYVSKKENVEENNTNININRYERIYVLRSKKLVFTKV